MNPAVLRQLNQDATKRQRTNPPVGTTQQVARPNIPAVGPSPSPSGLTTVGSASSTIQPVSSAREETSEFNPVDKLFIPENTVLACQFWYQMAFRYQCCVLIGLIEYQGCTTRQLSPKTPS
jgi:hypothetical protein